jgi:hypothetical protein
MEDRTVTRSVETAVPADVMLEILLDPRHIPQWAPGFADAIEPDAQERWQARKDGRTFSLQVVVARSSRTVDYLREIAPGKQGGAYIRVLPRPRGGSVIVMTLPVPAGAKAESVTAVLSQELTALVGIGERRTDGAREERSP